MAGYTQQLKKHLQEAGCQFERQGRGDHIKRKGSALDIGQISKTHKKKDASRKGAKALKK